MQNIPKKDLLWLNYYILLGHLVFCMSNLQRNYKQQIYVVQYFPVPTNCNWLEALSSFPLLVSRWWINCIITVIFPILFGNLSGERWDSSKGNFVGHEVIFPSRACNCYACPNYMVHTSTGLPWWLQPAVAPAARWALMERTAVDFPQTENVRYSHLYQTPHGSAWQSLWRGGCKQWLLCPFHFCSKGLTAETLGRTINRRAACCILTDRLTFIYSLQI